MATVLLTAVAVRQQWPTERELSRKIIHIGTGFIIPIAWFCNLSASLVISLSAGITLLTAINRHWRIIPAVEDIDRNSYGTVAYGVSITLLLILFWPDRADAVTAGVLVMALGDGFAGLIGRRLDSARWTLMDQTKSLIGTSVMAGISCLVLTMLSFYSGTAVEPLRLVSMTIIAVILEQFSFFGIDNLTVPIVISILWSQLIA